MEIYVNISLISICSLFSGFQ